ncbi:hypothetical protein D3C86_1165090 [compost metagenome]
MRSRATRSWAWKVSVARATSLVATASADCEAWALRNSAMESRLSSISSSRASAASSAPLVFCQPMKAQKKPATAATATTSRMSSSVFMLRS